MTNKEAIEHIKLILLRDRNNELHFVSHDEEIALDLAIKALVTFRHVIIVHPKYGECDGWYDEKRHLLFYDFVTKEFADTLGWKIKEEE